MLLSRGNAYFQPISMCIVRGSRRMLKVYINKDDKNVLKSKTILQKRPVRILNGTLRI